jgi:hypothetical protein
MAEDSKAEMSTQSANLDRVAVFEAASRQSDNKRGLQRSASSSVDIIVKRGYLVSAAGSFFGGRLNAALILLTVLSSQSIPRDEAKRWFKASECAKQHWEHASHRKWN